MKSSNTTTSGKATDMIAGICTFPRLPCPRTKRHVMLNLTSTGVCNTGTSALKLYVCNLLLWLTWWWMLLYRTLRKVRSANMRKNMYVVTPRCAAAAAVVSAVVFRHRRKNTRTRTPWCIGIHAPVLHDASQIAHCRYWGRASLPPITSINA